jgi:hypothetical protein
MMSVQKIKRAQACGPRPFKRRYLSSLNVADSNLARAAVFLRVELDLLALDKVTHASALKGGSVDEYVLAAVVRLNEAEALLIVVEFNSTGIHDIPQKI